MKVLGYYNGVCGPLEEMTVPMNDRACYFGDGVYDATCVVNHVPMAFDDHIDRIYRSAKLIDIEIPMEKAEMKRMLQGLVDQVEGDVLFLYWQVTRGVGMRNHPYAGAGDKPSIWAFVRPSKMRDPFGVYKCITVEDKRFFYCNIKTINLLPAVMANEKAMQAGCDEAIFHRGERVTECSHSNVHIIKDGTLYTAPCDELILPGITRAHILNICRQEGIPVVEEPFTLDEMMDADEIFFSSSSALTCRIGEIDGKKVGVIGQIHPLVAETYGIGAEVYAAELDFTLLQSMAGGERVFHPLPKFPAVARDLALVCDESLTVGELESCITAAAGKLLRKINLFDIYRGVGIEPGKKSVAFSLELRADDRTLTDEDSVGVVNKVLEKLETELHVKLR